MNAWVPFEEAIVANSLVDAFGIAAQCVAIAELSYRESVAYNRARQAFGKPLTGFQVVRRRSSR